MRKDTYLKFDAIAPAFQEYLRRTVTLFGAESCGKTTMAYLLSQNGNGHFVPEWAREYLETVGTEITDDAMQTICEGQYASQMAAKKLIDKAFIFQDTDLYSTLGYYRLWNNAKIPDMLNYWANTTKSDLYIVMNDKIPFEPDPLRYGGTVRESTMDFWIDILKEFNCNYYVVKSTNKYKQYEEVVKVVIDLFDDFVKPLREFKRT